MSYRRRWNESQISDVFAWKDGPSEKRSGRARVTREQRNSRHQDLIEDYLPAAGVPTIKSSQKNPAQSKLEQLQANLLTQNDERAKLQRELEKLPDSRKNYIQQRRKHQLEFELEQVEKSISSLKDKIRSLNKNNNR